MELKQVLFKAKKFLELKKGCKITQQEMADLFDIKKRTYIDYNSGTNQPIAAIFIMNLLASMEWEDAKVLLEQWKEENLVNHEI